MAASVNAQSFGLNPTNPAPRRSDRLGRMPAICVIQRGGGASSSGWLAALRAAATSSRIARTSSSAPSTALVPGSPSSTAIVRTPPSSAYWTSRATVLPPIHAPVAARPPGARNITRVRVSSTGISVVAMAIGSSVVQSSVIRAQPTGRATRQGGRLTAVRAMARRSGS
jgi:hypothetical protein